jgi:CO/xanthine dehydrogenase FAD-binding subunit
VPFELVVPGSPEEAFELLRRSPPGGTAVLAGGTDLLLDLEQGRLAPRRVLSLRRLGWATKRWMPDGLEIGSTLPLSELEADPGVRERLPGLVEAVSTVGSRALRNRATLGGNLARSAPASDMLPILLALGATVELVGPAGARTLSVEEFVRGSRRTALAPEELVRCLRVPPAPSTYVWQRVRPANDVSQVGVAVARVGDGGWRIAVGGVLPIARRLGAAEAHLVGRSPAPESIRSAAGSAAEAAPFPTDKRASEEHRRRVVRALVERAVRALGRPEGPP